MKLGLKPFNFIAHGKKFYFAEKSLCCLSPNCCLRKACVWLIEWWPYKLFVIISTCVNVLTLMAIDFDDPALSGHRVVPTQTNQAIEL